MVDYVFSETTDAANEITRLFDFVWPTAVALWNLRWQVAGYLSVVPEASVEDIASRFVLGSDIHGADIRRMSFISSWDEQKTRFAHFVLTNVFAIYESWAGRLVVSTGLNNIPPNALYRIGNTKSKGLSDFVSQVNSKPSIVMQKSFQASYLDHKKVNPAELINMLKCYKYFKEIRNCQIHNGGIATQRSVAAFNEFQPVSGPSSLKTKKQIEYAPVILGDNVQISLRGVVGFCDIALRMMITVDAQISGSIAAEKSILNKVKKVTDGRPHLTLNADKKKADRQIRGICRRASLPKPQDIDYVRDLLLNNQLIYP